MTLSYIAASDDIKNIEYGSNYYLFKGYYEYFLDEKTNQAKFLNALKNGDFKRADEILKSDSSVLNSTDITGFTPLSLMVDMGNKDSVEFLLKNKADVNKTNYNSSYSPMLELLEGDSVEIAKMLLDSGADINTTTTSERNALYKPAIGGNAELVKFLLESGIKFDKSLEQTDRILSEVKSRGHNEILKMLEDKFKESEKE